MVAIATITEHELQKYKTPKNHAAHANANVTSLLTFCTSKVQHQSVN